MESVPVVTQTVAEDKKSKKPSQILTIDFDATYFHAEHPAMTNPVLRDARKIAKKLGWGVAIVTHRSHSESLRNIKDAVEPLMRLHPLDWKIRLKQALLSTHYKKFHGVNTPLTVFLGKSHAKKETVKKLMDFEDSVYKFICTNANFNDLFREANTFLNAQDDFAGKLERTAGTCRLFVTGVQDIALYDQAAKSHFLANGYGKNCPKEVAMARHLVFMTKFFDHFKLEHNETKQPQLESLRNPELVRIVHIDDSETVIDAYPNTHPLVKAIHYPKREFIHDESKAEAKAALLESLRAVGIDVVDYRKRQIAIQKFEAVASSKVGGHKKRVLGLIDYIKDLKHADWEQVAIDNTINAFDQPKTGKDFDGNLDKGFKRSPRKSGAFWNTLNALKVELHSGPEEKVEETEMTSLLRGTE